MRALVRTARRCVLPIVLVALTGCGAGDAQLGEVTGTVRYKGKPVPKVRVYFNPDISEAGKSASGRSSYAMTDEQGRYTLTYDDHKSGRSGAVVGLHVVVVDDPEAEDQTKRTQVSRVPLNYSRITETPLRQEVKSGSQTIDLDLE